MIGRLSDEELLFTEHVDCHARYEEMVAKCQVNLLVWHVS